MTTQEALFKYTLRLGDNGLIQGQRLSEWCSRGPILEEDLAITNLALDNIGRAQAFLKYAGEVEGKQKTEDDLAFKRGEREFYNLLMTELPIGDFAYTVAKQVLISAYEYFLYTELSNSTDEIIAGISQKAIKEVRYHLAHAKDWSERLGNGTEESKARLQKAYDELWSYTGEFFETTEEEKVLAPSKVAATTKNFEAKWNDMINEIFTISSITPPTAGWMQSGSQNGIHTEHLGHLLSEMQYLQRAYPDAKW
ncbi:MAG: 1,2-phenylacetyl-CoA epoxidase subunit PaaC [Crocinitomicaceae bacterium]